MTLAPSDWELLHREVDGETSGSEAAGLRERLASEPELRAAYEALVGVGRSLSEAGLADPPPELAADIMRQVRQRPAPGRRRGWLAPLSGWVVRQPALAVAASLAVGLLAGLLVTGLTGPGLAPLDGTSVSGTLLPPGHRTSLPLVDEARLEGGGIRATALTRSGDGVVVVELEILSGDPVDVTVRVDPNELRPRGFECLGGEPTAGVVVEAGGVRVRQAPAGRCVVSLASLGPSPAPVIVLMETGSGGRAEATLRAVTSTPEGR